MRKFLVFKILVLLSSCGLFLNKTGLKNYQVEIGTNNKELNKYQYDFVYLTELVEKAFPFRIHIYKDKWFLRNIQKGQDSLLISKQITKINNVKFRILRIV